MWLSQGLNQGLQIGPAILDKSAWDSVAVVSVISWCPLKTVKLFQKCLAGLPPAGLKSNLICGLWWGVEGGGARHVWFEGSPTNTNLSQGSVQLIVAWMLVRPLNHWTNHACNIIAVHRPLSSQVWGRHINTFFCTQDHFSIPQTMVMMHNPIPLRNLRMGKEIWATDYHILSLG